MLLTSQVVLVVKNKKQKKQKDPACQYRRRKRHRFVAWVGKISWRRKWQPTPVFLPGKSHGPKNLTGYSTWCLNTQLKSLSMHATCN